MISQEGLDSPHSQWILDSGCSRHMSGEEQLFNNVTKQDLSSVTFGDNSRARAVGIGYVGFAGTTQVEQVLLIDGLKHNLLSIS